MYKIYSNDTGNYVLVGDIARQYYKSTTRIDSTGVKRRLESNGLQVYKTLLNLGRSSLRVWAIKEENSNQADEIMKTRRSFKAEENDNGEAWFYIIQKYPKHAPQIIKMGKTTRSVSERIMEFNIYSPNVLLEKKIKGIYEKTLIDMIGGANEKLGEEEFFVEDIANVIGRAEQALQLLS